MRLVFSGEPHVSLTAKLLSIQHSARQRFGTDLIDSIVGYTTLTLFFEPHNIERDRAAAWLQKSADGDTDGGFLAELAARPVVGVVQPSGRREIWIEHERGARTGLLQVEVQALERCGGRVLPIEEHDCTMKIR